MNPLNVLLYFPGDDTTASGPDPRVPVSRPVVPSANHKRSHLARYSRTTARIVGFGAAVLANTVGFLMLMSGLLLLVQIAQAGLA